jgi:hypothetical protein
LPDDPSGSVVDVGGDQLTRSTLAASTLQRCKQYQRSDSVVNAGLDDAARFSEPTANWIVMVALLGLLVGALAGWRPRLRPFSHLDQARGGASVRPAIARSATRRRR